MPRYSNDPRWIVARHSGRCARREKCPATAGDGHGGLIQAEERVFYYPLTRSVYCVECSPAVARQAEAELADDDRGEW